MKLANGCNIFIQNWAKTFNTLSVSYFFQICIWLIETPRQQHLTPRTDSQNEEAGNDFMHKALSSCIAYTHVTLAKGPHFLAAEALDFCDITGTIYQNVKRWSGSTWKMLL